MDERALREEIVGVCRRLYERGLIAGPDGNVSARLADDTMLVTPTGMSKVDVGPEDLVVVGMDGRRLSGYREPSSEVSLHVRIYLRRPDVGAVVHAHPPVATGFAVAGEGFERSVLPELIVQLGAVPLVPYATPGTGSLPDECEPYMDAYDALLLANHGAVTTGPTLLVAHQRMESLEHAARITLVARQLGRVNELTSAQVAALSPARSRPVVQGAETESSARESKRGD
ncbi:MAG TPA: class II aldolase/adducin family protein [Gemmatimonadaceae bacterium]|nr:class II aldolase/adducin family protein [Gemmatimonadaceae bacterium]